MIDLSNKKLLLIGGGGFIGHNLALGLEKVNAEVYVIDSLQVNNLLAFSSYESEIPNRDLYLKIINQRLDLIRESNVRLYVQDARDYHAMYRLVEKISPDVIIHLAAVAHAGKSNKDPYSTFDHSSRTLENALDFARYFSGHFIYFSSSMVYGTFKDTYVTEESTCNPLGVYGALKFGGEKLVIAYNQVFDLPYTIIRPSALYGPRCVSRRVGQIFIENALEGKEIQVYGEGEERLDFTYVDDLVQGVIKCVHSDKAKNEVLNLTYGESRSINDMLNLVKDNFPGVSIRFMERDKLIPKRGTLSVDKAKKLIDYSPEHPLEKGFIDYIEWYKSIYKSS